MTDRNSILRAFNNYFFEFVDYIIFVFPENRDIKNSKTSFEIFRKANPTSLLKAWDKFVYQPYKNVIEEGNIDFFFQKDYNDDLKLMANANQIMAVIDTIREPLKNLKEDNKTKAVVFIQNLSKLSNLYSTFTVLNK
jgi:hypothetical protein